MALIADWVGLPSCLKFIDSFMDDDVYVRDVEVCMQSMTFFT